MYLYLFRIFILSVNGCFDKKSEHQTFQFCKLAQSLLDKMMDLRYNI